MNTIVFALILISHLPAFAEDYEPSAEDVVHEVVWRVENQRTPDDDLKVTLFRLHT